jgi:hypothetical protein
MPADTKNRWKTGFLFFSWVSRVTLETFKSQERSLRFTYQSTCIRSTFVDNRSILVCSQEKTCEERAKIRSRKVNLILNAKKYLNVYA